MFKQTYTYSINPEKGLITLGLTRGATIATLVAMAASAVIPWAVMTLLERQMDKEDKLELADARTFES